MVRSSSEQRPSEPIERARYVRDLFASVAHRYDLMNTLMSAGLDKTWRRRAVAAAAPQDALALDIGSGTGEMALELLRQGARAVVALDFGATMLRIGRAKHEMAGRSALSWLQGDALQLPFADETFDVAVAAFTLRNVADINKALAEVYRVLRPGGRFASLDVLRLGDGLAGLLFRLYFAGFVPLLGALVTGRPHAYRYLAPSVERFLSPEALAERMAVVGFGPVEFRPVFGQFVYLHTATRPAA